MSSSAAPSVSVLLALTDHSQIDVIAAAIVDQTKDVETVETIVVDAIHTPEAQECLARIDAETARRIGLQSHVIAAGGRGWALNEAIRRASGELLVFIADDYIPLAGCIQTHIAHHVQHPGDRVVSIGPSKFPDHLTTDPFTAWLNAGGATFNYGTPPDETPPQQFFYGANTAMKPALIWEAGLFDGDFPYDALEDFELAVRLRRVGMDLHYLPDAVAAHEHPLTVDERAEHVALLGESAALFEAKYPNHRPVMPGARHPTWAHAVWGRMCSLIAAVVPIRVIREAGWRHTLLAAYLGARERAAARLGTSPARRISTALPAWVADALREGALRWDGDPERAESRGLALFENDDSTVEPAQHDGRHCVEIRNPHGAPWAYFRIDPIFARPDAGALRLDCEIHAPEGCPVWVHYDSADESVQVVRGQPGAFKSTERVAAGAGWSSVRFTIDDLRPAGRINGGDFRIACGLEQNDPFFLGSIEVTRDAESDAPPVFDMQSIAFAETRSPTVSIVIPVHNQLIYTLQCLQSIAAHRIDAPYEVIVVDDASTDGTSDALARAPGVRRIALETNVGFTGACNRGAQDARGEYLVFLNNDTIPQPGWLDALVTAARETRDAGVVGSRLIYPQTGAVQHAGIAFDEDGLPYHLGRDRLDASESQWSPGDETRTVDVAAVTGACFLTPRALFEELEGLEEAYDEECQDIDYCLQVRRSGRRVVYCGASVVQHYESVTRAERDADLRPDSARLKERWPSPWLTT